MKVSRSFIIDSPLGQAFENARNFFSSVDYKVQNEIEPQLLVFKKRMSLKTSASSKSEDFIVRLKILFNPVGNLQLYATPLTTVRCDYAVRILGREATPNDTKIFVAEANELKNVLVGKYLSKSTPAPVIKSCTRAATNLCKEICENSQIQVTFTQPKNEIRVGEEEKLEVYIKNVGDTVIFLKVIENILSDEFQPLKSSNGQLFENKNLNMNRKLRPLESDKVIVTFEALRRGTFEINPKIIYVDDVGVETVIECHTKVYKVLEAALPGRIPTGFKELDNFLFGGLPEKYAVVFTSPSIDEREVLIKSFLRAGVNYGEVTFYITFDSENARTLANEFQEIFYLFLTNPRADETITNLPNVFKLNGVSTLSNINIALTKSLRMLDQNPNKPRRICIDIISDVLLQHQAVITRKWISELISELKSKGFTIIAVLNPLMHPPDQVQAILGLFDGEINIYEKETKEAMETILRIKKMYNQKYSRGELELKHEFLDSQ